MIKETVEQLKGKGAYKRVDIVEKNIYREEIIINKPIKVANEEQRPRVVLKLIKNRIKEGGKILVFTSFARENEKRKDAESLTKFYRNNAARIGLKKNQIACYHAQMDPEERSIAQEKFKNGRVKLLVATKAFGMGVDIKNINAVIHIYPPVTIEEYYQEIGRGGRNATKQEPAIAQLIWSDDDEENLRPFINGRWDFRYMQIYYLLSQGYIVICEEDDNQSLAISKYMAEWYKNKWISKPRKRKIGRYHILGTRVRDRRSARKICEFISDKRNESKRKAPKDVKRVARWLYSYLSIKNDSFIIPPPVYIPRSLRAPVNHYKEVLSVMEESGWVIRSETDTNENGSIYSKYKILLDDLPADIIKDFGEMISLESERKYDSWTLMQKVCQSKDPWRIIMKNLYGKDK